MGGQQRPEGMAEGLGHLNQVEPAAAPVSLADALDHHYHDQHRAQEQARQQTGQQHIAHRRTGGHRVENHQDAGGNDGAKHAAHRLNSAGKTGVISLFFHGGGS